MIKYREWRNSRRISTPQRRSKSLLLETMMSGKKLHVERSESSLTSEKRIDRRDNNGVKGTSVGGGAPVQVSNPASLIKWFIQAGHGLFCIM
jgi:hypothetical protein